MIRFVVILLTSVLLISLLRSIVGIILKGFADLMGSGGSTATATKQPGPAEVPLSGELKRDPVCGTFVSTATALKKSVAGQVVYYCSPECREKHKV